jgi:uncharacterized HAD superfamily protein
MNLGFDIDGVIANFSQPLLRTIKETYGLALAEKDITSFSLTHLLGITRNEETQLITDILCKDLPIYPGASSTLEKLSREGHTIYLLTGRYSHLREITEAWLKDNGVPYNELHLLEMGKKYQVNISGLDVIVEDSLDEALEWSTRVKTILLFDHPYNQTLNVKNLTKRVYSWDEIYLEIHRLAGDKPI